MPLIIDAMNVRMGGAMILLNYLVKKIQQNNIDFKLLVNEEVYISDLIDDRKVIRVKIKNYFSRSSILKSHLKSSDDTLFCFANFPPSFKKKDLRVITFFHNYVLLPDYNLKNEPFKERLAQIIKRLYLKIFAKNSDIFVFQSTNVQKFFIDAYKVSERKCHIIPFFDEEKIICLKKDFDKDQSLKKVKNNFIFVGHPSVHKNQYTLLKAWEKLLEEGITPKLFLTIPNTQVPHYVEFNKWVNELQSKGAHVYNLGDLKFEEVLKATYESEFCIYPSLIESFGLGLLEADYMDLKILASDLAYVHAIIEPSLTFDPNSIESIYNSVITALNSEIKKPKVLIKNQINDFISLLKQAI